MNFGLCMAARAEQRMLPVAVQTLERFREACEKGDVESAERLQESLPTKDFVLYFPQVFSSSSTCPLVAACERDDVPMVRYLLSAHFSSLLDRQKPLEIAAHRGHTNTVALLLDDFLTSPTGIHLYQAARAGHASVVSQLLLHTPANQVNFTCDQHTSLAAAVVARHIDVVDLFLTVPSVDVNLGQVPPLSLAVMNKDLHVMKKLLERDDVKVNLGSPTALTLALSTGDMEVLGLLLERQDLDVNSNVDQVHPFVTAIYSGHPDIALRLLSDQRVQLPLQISTSVLCAACGSGSLELVQRLLAWPNLSFRTLPQQLATIVPPLSVACDRGNEALFDLLMAQPDVNLNEGDDQFKPLVIAIKSQNLHFVSRLVHHPLIDLSRSYKRHTPLYAACEIGNLQIVQMLLRQEAVDVNKGSDSPLSIACEKGHRETIKLLLTRPDIDVSSGCNNPVEICCKNGDLETLTLLTSSTMADLNSGLFSPLYCAAKAGHVEVVRHLLSLSSIDVNRGFDTPLYGASESNHVEIVRLLLKCPSLDVNLGERTPLFTACEHGSYDVIDLLLSDERTEVDEDTRLQYNDLICRSPSSFSRRPHPSVAPSSPPFLFVRNPFALVLNQDSLFPLTSPPPLPSSSPSDTESSLPVPVSL